MPSLPRRYKDAITFRIGAEYQLKPQLTLLADVRYDETPIRAELINPEFIDANRIGLSAGPCYQLTRRLNLKPTLRVRPAARGPHQSAQRTGRQH